MPARPAYNDEVPDRSRPRVVSMESPEPRTTELSRRPVTAWVMLAIALPVGGWLLWEIHRTIGLSSPRLWELLRTDRVFDLAMLDFTLTAGWAALVLIERSSPRDWRFWVSIPIFMVIPTLGIIVFILLDRSRPGRA
ncbi:hypothetical protein P12x_000930 [Tundrisphaera lichenicola]|uniref:hypothetical protein n=1 Tax=Tundrisphaera lichenicola TaxID=2029860 RepID=UPI003EBB35E7